MARKEQLLAKLRKSPSDKTALDDLVAFFAQRGDFQALYEGLQEIIEGIEDQGILAEFQSRLVDIVRKHLAHAADPILAANLKLRLAGLLYEKATDPKEAVILVTEAFERLPSEEVAQRAVHMLREMKLLVFVVQLLTRKAEADVGTERHADTLFQLGHAALSAGNVHQAREAFRTLGKKHKSWAGKAKEGEMLVDNSWKELEDAIAALEDEISKANDVEQGVLKAQLSRKYLDLGKFSEGMAILEEVMDQSPTDELCMQLVSAYKELSEWGRLLELVETWAEQTKQEEARKELYKERVRVYALELDDRKKGYKALDALYKRYPGEPDVVEYCVQIYSQCDDSDSLAALLGRARQDTRDRDHERRYLEWEAALTWRKLKDLDGAEKLYRRIKSIDPRNEAALLFYEEFCREKGDFRKLYSILSTRQSLAPESQKVRILKSMAAIAEEQLDSPDRAVDAYKKVLGLEPADEVAFARLAELLEQTRRWHAVIEHYSAKVDRLPEEEVARKLELLLRMRDIYTDKSKLPVPEMVVTVYRRILQIDALNGDAIEALGEYYRKNNRWGELTEVLERKCELESDRRKKLKLHKEIAHILVEYQHQEGTAIPHLEQVVQLSPKDDEALKLLAKAYRSRGEFEKFFEVGRKLLSIVRGSERKDLLEELATIALERLQAEEEAADLLQKLFAADPRHPWALRRLQQLYEQLGRYEELAELLTRGIDKAPAAKKRPLKEKLGALLADRLARFDEAKAIFDELLEDNPNNRQAKQYKQRILAQSGDFPELQGMYEKEKNLPGLLRFLDEYRQKEEDESRARAAGMEMHRIAGKELKDKNRASQVLESLLEQFPDDAGIARMLLSSYPKKKEDLDVARALGVIADNAEGTEAREAGIRLGEVLEKVGEHDAAYTRTLGLFLRMVRDEGDLSLMGALVDRAESAESLDNLAEVAEDLLAEELPSEVHVELAIQVAQAYKARLKDIDRAMRVLNDELQREPDSLPLLEELERIYMGTGRWDDLEGVVRAMADLTYDLGEKKEKLHKLARLYEEIVGEPEKAGAVYGEIRELDPKDEEAYSGLKRILEEVEKWDELAQVLEDELQVASDEQTRENLMQLASLYYERLDQVEEAAQTWGRVVERWADDDAAWNELKRLFENDEALAAVLPLLEKKHGSDEAWTEQVEVLGKKAQFLEDDAERFETLGRCAEILNEKLEQPGEAFSYLSVMLSMNPSEEGLIQLVEKTGRAASRADELFNLYKGLLVIGDSDFEPQQALAESSEQEVSLLLADLAEELDDHEIAIESLRRARLSAPSELSLFERLEVLIEAQERYEELLELFEEKREYVWDEQEKIGLYARIADVLTNQLDREEESIHWVEELYSLARESVHVAERLEGLYLNYERWSELASLLRAKLARLEDEERRAVAYQLAIIYRDNLDDIVSSYELLSEIVSQEPDNETYLDALGLLLRLRDSQGYDSVVLKVVAVLEPLARERKEWDRLVDVLEVKAEQAPEAQDACAAWYKLGVVARDNIEDKQKAFEAFARAVEKLPAAPDSLQALVETGEELGRMDEVIAAIEEGIGDVDGCDDLQPLAALALALRKHTDDLARAAGAYERLLELSPEELETYWALDEIYEQSDDHDGRIRVLSDAVERLEGPRQADVFLTLAELQVTQDNRDDAVDSLYRALENPDLLEEDRRALAYGLLGSSLEEDERWFDLCQVLVNRVQTTDDSDEKRALLLRAAHLEEENLSNPDNAIKHYYTILDLEPVEPVAAGELSRLLETTARFNDLEEVLSTQAELTDVFEDKKDLLVRLARVRLFDLSSPDRAVDALSQLIDQEVFDDEVVELLEQVVESFSDMGFRATQLLEAAYRVTERFDKLAEIFKTQIDQYADEVDKVERYRELATLYEVQFSDVDAAFHFISDAFKLEPTSEAIHDRLVSFARERASFDELFDIYLDVLVQLDEPESRNNLRKKMVALYHDEQQDIEHAEMIYRDMLDDEPGNEFAVERLQQVYLEQENWERLVEVLRIKAENARTQKLRIATLYEIAACYRERTGDMAEALDTYEQILSLEATQWDAYRGIESLYFERGDVQGVTASLRRELEVRETADEKKEVRLRLAAILFTELEEYDQSVEEMGIILGEFPGDESALELLDEIVDTWEAPSDQSVELLVAARTEAEAWDTLIALYQKLAGRATSDAEKLELFEKIYELRTTQQQDDVGAYAVSKIMLILDPADEKLRERLLEHANATSQYQDLAEFLEHCLEIDQVAGTELEVDYQAILADILETHLQDSKRAVSFFESVAASDHMDRVKEAHVRLRKIYQDLESWDKYAHLLETLAGEEVEPSIRRAYLLEAAQVTLVTLEDPDRAYEILSSAAQEFPDDDLVLDRYEKLLVETEKLDDLELLLRDRVDRCLESQTKAQVRLRLGNLLLSQEERLPEGIDELLLALEESPEMTALWNMLEHLLESDDTPEEDRIRIARVIEEKYPEDAAPEKRRLVLEIHLSLVDEPEETNRLNLALAGLLEEADEGERSFFHYSQALRLFPGVEEVEEKLNTLAASASLHQDHRDLLAEVAETAEEESLQVRYLLETAAIDREQLEAPADAALLYERILETDAYNKTALEQLAVYYHVEDQFEKLQDILERQIGIEEDSDARVEKTLTLARLYGAELEDSSRARQWWEELIHEPVAREEAGQKLEQIYAEQEEWELLADLYLQRREEVEDADGKKAVVIKLASVYEQHLDRVEEAFHWYKELLALDSQIASALRGVRRCGEALEDWEAVADADEKLLASAEEEEAAQLQRELASIYIERLGKKEEGLAYLQSLLHQSPVAPEVKALALAEIADPQIGFQVGLTLEPVLEEGEEWENLIQLYETQLEQVVEVEEKIPIAIKAVDIFYGRLQDEDRAFEMLTALLEGAPGSQDLTGKLSELAEQTSNWTRFVEALESAHGYAGEASQLVAIGLRIAQTFEEKLEDPGSACDWYRRVLEEEPANTEAVSQVERLLEALDRYEDLVSFYEQVALDFDGPERIPLLLKQGFIKEGQLEDAAGAVQVYKEVLSIAPDNQASLGRLDGMLENPILGLAAMEILEPIYRRQGRKDKLARLLTVKAGEVEGSLDRSQLLAEAANMLAQIEGREQEAFESYLQAMRQKRFDSGDILTPAMDLAARLDKWQDLANVLEQACAADDVSTDLKPDLLRRLALIYLEKLTNSSLAELKLREVLNLEPENGFALNMLAQVLENQGESKEEIEVLERLGDISVDAETKQSHYGKAAQLASGAEMFERAGELYLKALKVTPDDADLMEQLSSIYRLTEAWEELVELLETRSNLLEADEAIGVLLEAAHVAAENMDVPSRALAICRLVLDRDKVNRDALLIMTDILSNQGKQREYLDALEGLAEISVGEEKLEILWKLKELAVDMDDQEAAIAFVQRILDADPGSSRALEQKIELLKNSENLYNLVATYEEQAGLADDLDKKAELLYEAAVTLADEIGDTAAAIEKLEAIRALKPDHLKSLQKTAQVYLQRQEYEEAVLTFDELAGQHDDPAMQVGALRAAARIALHEMEDAALAQKYGRLVLERDADDQEGFTILAGAFEKQENYDELVKLLLEQVKTAEEPEARAALCKRLALVYRDGLKKDDLFLNWTEEAHKSVEDPDLVDELLTHYRGSSNLERVAPLLEWKIGYLRKRRQLKIVPELLFELGTAQEQQGRQDRALGALRECVSIDGSYLPGIFSLALLLVEVSQQDEALSHLQTLLLRINELESPEQKISVYLNLARIFLDKGDGKRAKTYLTRLLSIDKKHAEAKELLGKV